ncbi:hypothetical protein JCGZ_23599 [Jatropha curcas]|uniref:Uncharacterized protein n=1 Tax=Jatropha curcas TaxID=180498 RepID=A0A067JIJ9_JATCU|nr:hypothetical protein JCGZ_23599 [Jatropha curcas]
MEERDLSRWTKVKDLTGVLKGKEVLIRGRAETIRVTKDVVLVVVRQRGFTVQCVITVQLGLVSDQMVVFVASLSPESIIDV